VIFTCGISASGKSSWAADQFYEDPSFVEIVERDMIRRQILVEKGMGFSWANWKFKWEKEVTKRWRKWLVEFLDKDYPCTTIIIADTNLNKQRLDQNIEWIDSFDTVSSVSVKYFPISFEEAIKRDNARENGVGYSVIARQIEQWNSLMGGLPKIIDVKFPDCIICDIDGTLARMHNRSAFEYNKVLDDKPNDLLIKVLNGLKKTTDLEIFLFSGREAVDNCRQDTEKWLELHNVEYDQLVMREDGNHEPDDDLKERFYRQYIWGKYNCVGVFDDRPRVVRRWRELGLETYALGNQLIEF